MIDSTHSSIQFPKLFSAINVVCSDHAVTKAIEIGGGTGDGATAAIVSAFSKKYGVANKFVSIELSTAKFKLLKDRLSKYTFATAINGNSVAVASYPTKAAMKTFFWAQDSDFRKVELKDSISRKDQELAYITARGLSLTDAALAAAVAITTTADVIVINGSDFTGSAEYAVISSLNPKYFVLVDCKNIRNLSNKASISAGAYTLRSSGIESGIEWRIYKHN